MSGADATSAAMARASSVLPVPGGPIMSTPLGMRPPRRVNFFGSFRKAMISSTSSLASSIPATSAKVTFFWFSDSSLAFDLPKLMALPPPTCSWRMKSKKTTATTRIGSHVMRICCQKPPSLSRTILYVIPALFSFSRVCSPMKPVVTNGSSFFFKAPRNSAWLPFMRISSGGAGLKSAGDFSTFWMNSENVKGCSTCRGLMSCQTTMKAKIIITQTSTVLWLLRTKFPYAEVVLKILTPKGDPSTQHMDMDPVLRRLVRPSQLRRPQTRNVQNGPRSIAKHGKKCPVLPGNLGVDEQIGEFARAAAAPRRHTIAREQRAHAQRPFHLRGVETGCVSTWRHTRARGRDLQARSRGIEGSIRSWTRYQSLFRFLRLGRKIRALRSLLPRDLPVANRELAISDCHSPRSVPVAHPAIHGVDGWPWQVELGGQSLTPEPRTLALRLASQVEERLDDARILPSQHGQDVMTNTRAGVAAVGVGGILHESQLALGQVSQNLRASGVEQGSNERPAPIRNSGQPGHACPAHDTEKHRLGLIVGSVAKGDLRAAELAGGVLQRGQANVPRGLLPRDVGLASTAHIHFQHFARNTHVLTPPTDITRLRG